jgi:hypothetical protein
MSAIGPVTPAPSPTGQQPGQGLGPDPLAAALPDARRAGEMRAAIEAGRYPVDPARLAERLLALGVIGPAAPARPGDRLA